jgi:hypothetical protein
MITMVFAGAAVDSFGVKPVYLAIALLVLAGAVIASTRKSLNDLNEVKPS